jgi:hypothetical protein
MFGVFRSSDFVIRASLDIRHSTFDIRQGPTLGSDVHRGFVRPISPNGRII